MIKMTALNQLKQKARLILLVLVVFFSADDALANYRSDFQSDYRYIVTPLLMPGAKHTQNARHTTRRYSQNEQIQLRSRSEVVNEVKERYNAKVLKISLNKQKTKYNVRVFMPSGKVRNLEINARR